MRKDYWADLPCKATTKGQKLCKITSERQKHKKRLNAKNDANGPQGKNRCNMITSRCKTTAVIFLWTRPFRRRYTFWMGWLGWGLFVLDRPQLVVVLLKWHLSYPRDSCSSLNNMTTHLWMLVVLRDTWLLSYVDFDHVGQRVQLPNCTDVREEPGQGICNYCQDIGLSDHIYLGLLRVFSL